MNFKKFCVFGADFEETFSQCVYEVDGKERVLCHDFEDVAEARKFLAQIEKSDYRAHFRIFTQENGSWKVVS